MQLPLPLQPDFWRQIQHERQSWSNTTRRHAIELVDKRDVYPAAIPLIRNSCVHKPVADYRPIRFKRGTNDFGDVLRARSGDEEQLCRRRYSIRCEKNLADAFGDRGAARFASDDNVSTESGSQAARLRCFARAFHAFKCDEKSLLCHLLYFSILWF